MNPHAERYCPTSMFDRLPNLSVPDGHLRLPFLHTLLRSAARCVLFVAGLILAASQAVYADTTWVAGAVSGTWTVEGSPYVIVDSSWVSGNASLTVLAGSEILFPALTSDFRVEGSLSLLGLLGDSITVRLSDSASALRGPSQGYGSNLEADYVRFLIGGRLNPRFVTSTLRHCDLRLLADLTGDLGEARFDGSLGRFEDCYLPDLYCSYSSLSLERCTLETYLSQGFGSLTLIDVHQLESHQLYPPYIYHIGSGSSSLTVARSDLRYLWVNFVGNSGPITVDSSTVDHLEISLGQHVTVTQSKVSYGVFSNCNGTVTRNLLDSLELTFNATMFHPTLDIVNNTFVRDEDCLVCGMTPFITLYDVAFQQGLHLLRTVNNIFYSKRRQVRIVSPEYRNDWDIFVPPSYNLTYGMDDPWSGLALGSGNVDADPALNWESPTYEIQYDSPARNTGDPSRTDLDGTRSDIGASWWDHRYDHPPEITTSNHIVTRWGDRLDLIVSASDEHHVRFWTADILPGWLGAPRALDSDELRLASTSVPFGAESLHFRVIATDNLGQQDEEQFWLEVHPTSILPDTIRGVLSPSASPYYADHDVVVLRDDTLELVPGVELQLDSTHCLPTLVVEGHLQVDGTADSTVLFTGFQGKRWNGIAIRESAATAYLSRFTISQAVRELELLGCRRAEVSNAELRPPVWESACIARDVTDSVVIQRCAFFGPLYITNSAYRVSGCTFSSATDDALHAERSTGCVSECWFSPPSHAIIGPTTRTIVDHCVFVLDTTWWFYGLLVDGFEGVKAVEIQNNTFVGRAHSYVQVGAQSSMDTTRLSISNNIFSGSAEWGIVNDPQMGTSELSIDHNCFDGPASLLYNYDLPGLGQLAAVNLNGDSTDIFGNIFMPPIFADSSYELTAGSPCVDAGVDMGFEFAGPAPDMGRWENVAPLPEPRSDEQNNSLTERVQVMVFPNPTNGLVSVFCRGIVAPSEMAIYNVLGQRVANFALGSGVSITNLALASDRYASGRYLIKVSSIGGNAVVPFVIIK
jgi:hypothetical protein